MICCRRSRSTVDPGDARASPSTSVSLPSTPGAATFSAVSSFVVPASSAATGASLTPLTVMVTLAVLEAAPSPSLAM